MRNPEQSSGDVIRLVETLGADVFVSVWNEAGVSANFLRLFPTKYLRNLFAGPGDIPNLDDFSVRYPKLFRAFVGSPEVTERRVRNLFPHAEVNIETMPEEFYRCNKLYGVEFGGRLADSVHPRNKFSLPMYYKTHKVDTMRRRREENGPKYDLVIRIRHDAVVSEFDDLVHDIRSTSFTDRNVLTSRHVSDNHVGDMFACGTSEAMAIYSDLWLRLSEYWTEEKALSGAPFNERVAGYLLYHHLKSSGLEVIQGNFYVHLNNRSVVLPVSSIKGAYEEDFRCIRDHRPSEIMALSMVRELDFAEKMPILSEADWHSTLSMYPDGSVGQPTRAIGLAYSRLNDVRLAEHYLRIAAKFYRTFWPQPAWDLANLLRRQERLNEAIVVLTENVLLFPDHHISWRDLGLTYEKVAGPEIALAFLKRAAQVGDRISISPHIERVISGAVQREKS
jgi:tetratricopeptide (TPR) repeat protein